MHVLFCMESPPICVYAPHTHNHWEIVYQLDNEARTQAGDRDYLLCPNEILLIPPGIRHGGSSSHYFREIAVRVEGVDFGDLKIVKDYRGDILTLLSMICRKRTEDEEACASIADSFIQAVYEMIIYEIGVSSGKPAIEQIKKEIHNNLSNIDFDLTGTIEKTGFDKDYFRRCFKKETGKTPTQYLTDLRIAHAKQLLSDVKSFSIRSIAHSCGFSDSLYFSTCFKKHVGFSPLAYRKHLFAMEETDA